MPVPRCQLKAQVVGRCKLTLGHTDSTHKQEDGADDDVDTVETGSCVEGTAVVTIGNA